MLIKFQSSHAVAHAASSHVFQVAAKNHWPCGRASTVQLQIYQCLKYPSKRKNQNIVGKWSNLQWGLTGALSRGRGG